MTDLAAAAPPPFSDYIVFVDESGDHSLTSIDPEYPVFVLSFCIVHRDECIERLTPALRRLKVETFGHDLVVLHEIEMRRRRGAFSALGKAEREQFMDALTTLIAQTDFTLIAVVIDKQKLARRYTYPEHPYHLAMQFGLERLREFLRIKGQAGRKTWVVCEARGAKEDLAMELAFRRICDGDNRGGQTLPFEVLIADKKTNSEGLQLADLTARPVGLSVLRPEQANRAYEVLMTKFFAGRHNCITGNGRKVFPTE